MSIRTAFINGLFKFIFLAMLWPLSGIAHADPASACYVNIVRSFNRMLVARTLVSDEGTRMTFGQGRLTSDGRFVVDYEIVFPNGIKARGIESVRLDASGVYLDQIVDGVTTRRYVATFETPFHVFRIRPIAPNNTDFIARECIRRDDTNGTMCYVKVRYLNDVIVSVFHEEPANVLSF